MVSDIKHILMEITIFRAPRLTNHSARLNQSDLWSGIQSGYTIYNFVHVCKNIYQLSNKNDQDYNGTSIAQHFPEK